MGSKWRLETDEDSSMEQKTWQVYSFGKRNVCRLHLILGGYICMGPERVSVGEEGEGHSM